MWREAAGEQAEARLGGGVEVTGRVRGAVDQGDRLAQVETKGPGRLDGPHSQGHLPAVERVRASEEADEHAQPVKQ